MKTIMLGLPRGDFVSCAEISARTSVKLSFSRVFVPEIFSFPLRAQVARMFFFVFQSVPNSNRFDAFFRLVL